VDGRDSDMLALPPLNTLGGGMKPLLLLISLLTLVLLTLVLLKLLLLKLELPLLLAAPLGEVTSALLLWSRYIFPPAAPPVSRVRRRPRLVKDWTL
jgi:hypothetical protein